MEMLILCYCILAVCNVPFDCMNAYHQEIDLGILQSIDPDFQYFFKIMMFLEVVTKGIFLLLLINFII